MLGRSQMSRRRNLIEAHRPGHKETDLRGELDVTTQVHDAHSTLGHDLSDDVTSAEQRPRNHRFVELGHVSFVKFMYRAVGDDRECWRRACRG